MTADADSWLEIRISGARERNSVIAALIAAGAQAVQEVGSELITWVAENRAAEEVRTALRRADPDAVVSIIPAKTQSWNEWRARVVAHRLGALTIAPPWLAENLDPGHAVIIDPAMAFGTGEHATTRGVIRLMQTIPLDACTVADLGAGSAILSIAAAKLGARSVVAIEIDPDATSNASLNIRQNGVGDRVHFIEGDASTLLPLIAPVDVILANILSSVLVDLLPVMRDSLALDGHAILSGILREERAMMLDAIDLKGWRLLREDTEDEWWSGLTARA
ncbi:MAG: 50S ribosomal protein L11 methyltransferase [Gemmatimonadaceae bacterium]